MYSILYLCLNTAEAVDILNWILKVKRWHVTRLNTAEAVDILNI